MPCRKVHSTMTPLITWCCKVSWAASSLHSHLTLPALSFPVYVGSIGIMHTIHKYTPLEHCGIATSAYVLKRELLLTAQVHHSNLTIAMGSMIKPSIYRRTLIHRQTLPLENEHVLVLRLLVVEDLLNSHAEAVAWPQRGAQFREPSFLEFIHSL